MSDVKWMTYSELAEALGIGGASARNLVRRKRWQRKPGNDGLARVGVPLDHLTQYQKAADVAPPVDEEEGGPADAPVDGGGEGGVIQALNRHIERLENEIKNLKTEHSAERLRAAQVDVLNAILDAERKRADELRVERDRLLDRLTAPPSQGFLARLIRTFG
jgi:uncharacterized protein (UPF0335 family)